MKYIKRFDEEDMIDWIKHPTIKYKCKVLKLTNYEIVDGVVNVDGSVSIPNKKLDKLPIKFGIIKGSFYCNNNILTTLEGAPVKVGGSFDCGFNELTSLKGGPEIVGRDYRCWGNKLITLIGCPEEVGGAFNCDSNQLTTLEGAPKKIGGGYFDCSDNKLVSLKGVPKIMNGKLHLNNNPIYEICKLFKNYENFQSSLDFNYLRGDKIYRRRLEKALKEIGVGLPDSIPGYEYI
jgi:hypothetical protein